MKAKVNWKSVLAITGAILAFNIGTGFASGQEVMQYFSVYGRWALLGGLAFGTVLSYGNYCFAQVCDRQGVTDGAGVLKYYLGKYLGAAVNWFYIFYLYMCVVVMYGGAASALNEQYGWPRVVGAVLIAVLCCITVLLGLRNIINVISKIGPILILISVAISVVAVVQGVADGSMASGIAAVEGGRIDHLKAAPNWLVAAINLATSSLLWYPNFIVELKQEYPMKDLMIGQTVGAFLVGFAEVVMAFAIIANISAVADLDVPFLYVASNVIAGFGAVYAIIIFLALYTTTCPLLWSAIAPFAKDGTARYRGLVVGGTALGLVIALAVPYDVLMNYVWVISGYVGMGIMAIMVVRVVYNRIKNGKYQPSPPAAPVESTK